MVRIVSIAMFIFLSFFYLPFCQAQQGFDKKKLMEQFGGMVFGTGTLSVDSEPQGASVYLDGILKGKTPLSISGVKQGTVNIRVELESYVPKGKEIAIKSGDSQNIYFQLEILQPSPAADVKISTSPVSPRMAGTAVTLHASAEGGTGRYEYRFLKKGRATGDRWIQVRDYSTNNRWTWSTKDVDVGLSQIAVHVRNAGSKAEKEAEKIIYYYINPAKSQITAATDAQIHSNPSPPGVPATSVTFTAAAKGGTGSYEYRFFRKGPDTGDRWILTQDYSPNNTWRWFTTGADLGLNQIAVHARSVGSGADKETEKVMNYFINPAKPRIAPATGVRISADPVSPNLQGTTVTFMGAGLGGTGRFEYKFLKKGPATGGRWVEMQDYSRNNIWSWPPKDADVGTNQISVHVRSVGSDAEREAEKVVTYVINPVELTPMARFYVHTDPTDAQTRILNIKPAYEWGMKLDKGWYQVEVSRKGYKTEKKWIELAAGENKQITISLEKAQVKQSYDITNCSSGTVTMVSESNELTVYGIEHRGIARSNHANKVFDNMSFHCIGIVRVIDGKSAGNGYCKLADPVGDFVVVEYDSFGEKEEGNWKYLQGTGKWKGITGSGKYRTVTDGKPITLGTFQGCVRTIGSFILPE